MTRWFTKGWWSYLFEKPWTLRKVFCRYTGHKAGPIWWNPEGYEPNMRCSNCGDLIG